MKITSYGINQSENSSNNNLLLFIFVGLNLFTKLLFIDRESIWLDESTTLYWSLHSFKEILDLSLADPNGPFYQFLMKIWISFFGTSEFSIRALPALLGSLTVIPLFHIGRRFFSFPVALTAIILFSVSNILIEYSHEARSYMLVCFLSTTSFYFFFKSIKEGKKSDLVWYTLINTILLYTHIITIILLFVQGVSGLLYIRNSIRKVLFVYGSLLVSVGLLMFWFLNNTWIGGGETMWMEKPSFIDLFKLFTEFLNSKYAVFISGIIGSLFLIKLLIAPGKLPRAKDWFVALFWGLLPVTIVFIVSITYNPRFIPRYMIYAVPGLYLAIAYVFVNLQKNNLIRIALVVLLTFTMISKLNLKSHKEELWEETATLVRSHQDENTLVIICAHYQRIPFAYYYDRQSLLDYQNVDKRLNEQSVFFMCEKESLEKNISWNPEMDKMILVLSHEKFFDPENVMLNYLKENYVQTDSYENLRGIRVFVFDLAYAPFLDVVEYHYDEHKVKAKEFGDVLVKKFSRITSDRITKVDVQGMIKVPENSEELFFVISTRGKGENIYHSVPVNSLDPDKNPNLDVSVEIPPDMDKHHELAIYIWQAGKPYRQFNIKDLTITVD